MHLTPIEQWILQILWDGETTSWEIWEEISGKTSQPKINGHMSNLHRLGLIRSFRRDSINLITLTPLGAQCCLSIYEHRLEDWRPS